MQHEPDDSLIRAVAMGDRAALHELYTRHGLHILNYLLARLEDRQLAEDVLQNVMLVVWRKADTFAGHSTVRTWLFAIAKNQMHRARDKQMKAQPLTEAVSTQADPAQSLEKTMRHEALAEAIRQLPQQQRQALELVFYRGMKLREAAEQLDIPENTLKSRLHRAKATLRSILTGEIDL